jgi:DNA anti-recombination protein RmuC
MPRSLSVPAALLVLASCAQVPQEAVELSATVGRDLAEVHRAHRALAVSYFRRMKGDVDRFIDTQYRPFMISATLRDTELVEKIKAKPEQAAALLDTFLRLNNAQAEKYRAELHAPLVRQETQVLQAIDDAYQNLQNANAVVTGHLASVRKVFDAQNEALRKANLEGLREKAGTKLAELSEKVGGWVEKAARGEEKVDQVLEKLKTLLGAGGSGPEH